MFDIVLKYFELGELIAILISIVSIIIAFYTYKQDKPILYVEKHFSSKTDDRTISFYFYLDNIGKQPTSIKEIRFHTNNNFIPKITLIEILKGAVINTAGKGLPKTDFVGINLPFHLMPHSSKLIRADLGFGTPENLQEGDNKSQILYLNIKHASKKDFTKKFQKEKKIYSLLRIIKNLVCR